MILGALEQSNLFGPSNKVLYPKKLVIKSGVCFLILFVLVDAILQKVVYFKNKSGTGVVFLALCMHLMVIFDNSSLFCLYIFVSEDLAFFPTVICKYLLQRLCWHTLMINMFLQLNYLATKN